VDGVVAADTAPATPPEPRWRLAPGVDLLAGTALSGEQRGHTLYLLVAPSGHRYAVSEPLYRLAELLRSSRSLAEIATALSTRLGRPLDAPAAAALIESKLAAHGLAVAEPPADTTTTREGESV
jgi:hypothetical protein